MEQRTDDGAVSLTYSSQNCIYSIITQVVNTLLKK